MRAFLHFIRHPRLWAEEKFDDWNRRELSALHVGCSNSVARDQWVEARLSEIAPESRLLDAGSGEQKYRSFCKHLKYVSQDHKAYDGRGDGVGGHVASWTYGETDLICDIASIPEPDASFDAILCTEVLEHVPDPIVVLNELCRLLKPGGKLILTVPFCSFTHFAPYHFSTGLSRYWYLEHLKRFGFSEISCMPNGNFFEYIAQEIRRLPQMTSEYTSIRITRLTLFSSIVILKMLQMLSKNDQGSSQYACFGWHVTAIKL
jgi:SAM-dependent methyltransferase